MSGLISLFLYAIVLITYLLVREYEIIFIFLAWTAGYWKEDIYNLFN